jgi:DNA invertase Pin-like site-specific DNA recombinase
MTTTAIYVRRGEHRHELEQLVRSRGWKLVDTFVDNGRRRDRRPEFRSMLAAARRRRFEVLVVQRSSVLARTLHELVKMLALLDRCGVRFVSATEPFETMSFRDIVAALGAFERDVISDRTREAVHSARRRGRQLGRPRAGVDDTIVAMRAAGHSFRAIADELGVGIGTVQRALERGAKTYRNGSMPDAAQPAVSS